MTTKEITVYEKNEKTYCESCKPQGGKRGTLVISLPDRVFCSGCGEGFYDIAETSRLQSEMVQREMALSQAFGYYHLQTLARARLAAKRQAAEPVLLSQDITINGQSYHIIGRTQDELASEARRMEEEYRVTLPVLQDGLAPDDMYIRPVCGHKYIIKFTSDMTKEDIIDLKTQMCPDCVRDMIEFEAACEAEYLASLVVIPTVCQKCGRNSKNLQNTGTEAYPYYQCGTCIHREARRINTREMYGHGRRGY